MQLPAEVLADTALIEVVRISAPPGKEGDPWPGGAVAHWVGGEVTDTLALLGTLPGSGQHRCGFSPGWSIRGYAKALEIVLFEAAFCFSCHEVRMHGPAVPPDLAKQFFDVDAPPSQELLARFRAAGT
ncbi:hypothetical protein BCL76_105150 [Streptomyces sp. CG 926]|uniref:hypothetical protein n=1 Tax=Streptomyces sp. CG 926 TaxID=1882405 RepID=UPI000D6D4F4C|nr:hypothetical protein [Streptomyces sp. CG 926]PWK70197.1 hypothetical protein BCL76_105150 [Streptomyces sp. CG 926]